MNRARFPAQTDWGVEARLDTFKDCPVAAESSFYGSPVLPPRLSIWI